MKKIFLVETISTFRHRYAIEANTAEEATDIFHNQNENDYLEEMSQFHIGELVSSTKPVSKKEYIRIFDSDNDYLRSWTEDQKFKFVITSNNK